MSRKTSPVPALLASLVIATTACGPRRHARAPVTTTSAEAGARSAAEYELPPDSPQGNVRLATMGIAQGSIHVRMIVTNRSTEPWTVDKGDQWLAVAVANGQAATMVQASAGPAALPARVEVPSGHSARIDLFFPLPAGARDAPDVPAFDALGTVRTASRTFTLPYSSGTRREPTPDSRWPAQSPTLVPDAIPRPPIP